MTQYESLLPEGCTQLRGTVRLLSITYHREHTARVALTLWWTQSNSSILVDTHLHEHPSSQPCPYHSRAKKLLALREEHMSWTQYIKLKFMSGRDQDTIQPQLSQCKQLNLLLELPSHLCILRSVSYWFGKESGDNTKRKYFLTHILSSLGTHEDTLEGSLRASGKAGGNLVTWNMLSLVIVLKGYFLQLKL